MKRQSPTLRDRAALGLQWNERIKHADRSGGRTRYPGRNKKSFGSRLASYTLRDFVLRQCPFCEVFFWKRDGSNRVTCYKSRCQNFHVALSVISETVAVDPDRPTVRRRSRGSFIEDENEAWAHCYYVGVSMTHFVDLDSDYDPFINAAWWNLEKLGLRTPGSNVPPPRLQGGGRTWLDPWLLKKRL